MLTKRNTIICDDCRKFCSFETCDEYIPFGCSSYDPPEPHEPSHVCSKCVLSFKEEWRKRMGKNRKAGDWQKSKAEQEVANELGLTWIGSNGHGTLGTKNFAEPYQYITNDEYKRLSVFPYWGYCKLCESKNKNGYCSDLNCEKSFKKSQLTQVINNNNK